MDWCNSHVQYSMRFSIVHHNGAVVWRKMNFHTLFLCDRKRHTSGWSDGKTRHSAIIMKHLNAIAYCCNKKIEHSEQFVCGRYDRWGDGVCSHVHWVDATIRGRNKNAENITLHGVPLMWHSHSRCNTAEKTLRQTSWCRSASTNEYIDECNKMTRPSMGKISDRHWLEVGETAHLRWHESDASLLSWFFPLVWLRNA